MRTQLMYGTQEDSLSIQHIASKAFGKGYLPILIIKEYIKHSKAIVIKTQSGVIGFCLFSTAYEIETDTSITDSLLFETIAIKSEFQNQGFGSQILNFIIQEASNQQLKSIHYKAWLEGPNFFFTEKLIKIGFVKIKRFENYWSSRSIKQPFDCKVCGTPPCECTMNLYELRL